MLPVPGGILANMAGGVNPLTMAALANAGRNPDNQPTPAPSPQLAAAIAQPAPVNIQPDANLAPAPDASALAPAELEPQRKGILGRLGDTLHDPQFKAEALRFAMGAMAPGGGGFGGGLSRGILAATTYADQRKAADEDARRFGIGEADKSRQMDLQGREIDNNAALGHEGHTVQKYGIDTEAGTARSGQGVQERDSIRRTGVQKYGIDTDAATTRRGQDVGADTSRYTSDNSLKGTIYGADASVKASAGDNAATVAAAGLQAGKTSKVKPEDALNGVSQFMPNLVKGFPSDPKAQAEAWADVPPDVQGKLASLYVNVDGDPDKFVAGAKDIINGATYDDGAGLFNLKDGWVPGQGNNQPAGDTASAEVRYDAKGQAYTKGPNGQAVRAPKFDRQ